MDTYRTPLRYPGGKRSLYKLICEILRSNGIADGYYVEAFAGGAGLGIELLLQEYVHHVYLNDADPHIFSFWQSVLNQTDAFVKKIESIPLTVEEWRKQREIYQNPRAYSTLDVGFSAFFLNRCNRSGILRGRPIGGLDQTGKWKIGARFNRKNLIARVEMISFYRERITVEGSDALVFLKSIVERLDKAKTLLYLDPPYYVMGRELYLNNYTPSDHLKLSQFIKSLPFMWVLSYDNVAKIREMYSDLKSLEVGFYYRANERKEGKELMFFSDRLAVPAMWESAPLSTRPSRSRCLKETIASPEGPKLAGDAVT